MSQSQAKLAEMLGRFAAEHGDLAQSINRVPLTQITTPIPGYTAEAVTATASSPLEIAHVGTSSTRDR